MMTRLELQVKLIQKFGNTLSNSERKRFELFNVKKLMLPAKVTDRFPTVDVVTGEGENAVTEQKCIIGYDAMVHPSLVTPLFVALRNISDTDYKTELKGNILCYEPALMPDSETTMAYTSWGLAFRFDQDEALTAAAAKIFIDMGFKLGVDKDNKQYFITDIEKLLKS